MLVSKDQIWGTIGGGQLEYIAIDHARNLLKKDRADKLQLDIPLGPDIGQCCGGKVVLDIQICDEKKRLELADKTNREKANQPHVYIFGAGHVGLALSNSLQFQPFNTMLVDSRKFELDKVQADIPTCLTAIPEEVVHSAKPHSAYVILTHDHALDFILAHEALTRQDAAYIGMIGSKTKYATFKNWRQREYGIGKDMSRLTCPIGGSEIDDKRPEIIAALTCAEIITAILNVAALNSSASIETLESP